MNNISFIILTIFSAIWRQRYIIISPLLVFPVMGYFVGISTPKNYQSHTSILLQETSKMNPFLKDFSISAMLKERLSGLETLLHSRHILGKVIQDEKLTDVDDPLERDKIILDLSRRLSMDMPSPDLIHIQLTGTNPIGMKGILESVAGHFIDQVLAPERSSIEESSSFLAQSLKKQRESLEKSEIALAQFKSENSGIIPQINLSNINKAEQLKEIISEKKTELASLQKDLININSHISRSNPVIRKIEEKLIEIRSEIALLKSRYTDKHSKVQAAKRKLIILDTERLSLMENKEKKTSSNALLNIESNSMNFEMERGSLLLSQVKILQNHKKKIISLKKEIKKHSHILNEIKNNIDKYGSSEMDLKKLERDMKIKTKIYEELLNRYEMAKVMGSLGKFEENRRIKVIDRPFTPSSPTNLSPFVYAIIGIFGGLFFGFGIAILFELLDSTIRTKKQLENLCGVPVLGRIEQNIKQTDDNFFMELVRDK